MPTSVFHCTHMVSRPWLHVKAGIANNKTVADDKIPDRQS